MSVQVKIIIGSLAVLAAMASGVARADLVFHDDFEDETIDANPMTPLVGTPWVNIGTPTGHTVQANPLVNPDNPSAQVLRSHRAGEPAGRAFIDLSQEQSDRIQAGELLTIRFQHHQPDPARSSIAFAIYQNDFFDFSENAVDVEFLIDREAKHYKDAINNFETTGLFGSDGWDDVELVVNYATDTWSISVNGALAGNLPFRNDGDYMTAATLLISPSVSQMTGFTDNIEVYIGEVPGGAENADFDGDGDVDGHDFLRWQRNVGTSSGATLEQGDANDNGAVDGTDLGIWKAQFGGVSITAIPEPSGLVLAIFVGLGIVTTSGARRSGRTGSSQ